jgi:hypothetical protein
MGLMRAVGTTLLALALGACGSEAKDTVPRPAAVPRAEEKRVEPAVPAEAAAEPDRAGAEARPAVRVTEEDLAEERRRFAERIARLETMVRAFEVPRTRTDCLPSLTPEEVGRLAAGGRVDLPAPVVTPDASDLFFSRLGEVLELREREVVIELFGLRSPKAGTQFLLSREGRPVATGRLTVVSLEKATGRIERVLRAGPPRAGDDVFLR